MYFLFYCIRYMMDKKPVGEWVRFSIRACSNFWANKQKIIGSMIYNKDCRVCSVAEGKEK